MREELTGVEALGDGGGVAEDSAAEAAGDARHDGRAAHHHHLAGFGAVAAPRGGGAGEEPLGRHGGGAGLARGLPAAKVFAGNVVFFSVGGVVA